MSGVAVYMEGGGDFAEDRARLRQGMSEFLRLARDAARQKNLRWKVTACGSRNSARDVFLKATKESPDTFNMLLVDSEVTVNSRSPRSHLEQRDGWGLRGIGDDRIHLMIQVMETWIIADPDKVAAYYEQHFLKSVLPRAQNLETVEKERIYEALKRATTKTQKGKYDKIGHAAALLESIDPAIVRRRCPSCNRLFATLTRIIDGS